MKDLVESFLNRDFFQGPDLAPPAPFLRADLDLGRFKLVELIGAGGMGDVWKAWAPDLRRHVAVKFVRGGDQGRLEREARIVAQMDHPNIAPVFETGRIEGRLYLVMPLVDGGMIHKAGLKRERIVEAVRDAARALDYAHQRGIIHRDIKPANILVGGDRIHLMDFGVARETRVDASVSIDGTILGTPHYMSPEQTRGSKVDGRADVYSLGATLYELLTGRPPFDGPSLFAVLKKVQEDDPVPPRKIDATVPEDLERIALKCLEKDPERRYARATDLADDLRRFIDGEPVLARPGGAAIRLRRNLLRRRWPVLAGSAAVLAGSMVLAWIFIQKPERDYLDAFSAGMKAWSEARVSTFGASGSAPERARAARDSFEKAAAHRETAAAHVMRGRCLQIEGKFGESQEAFETAHRLDPSDVEARLELAKVLLTRVRNDRRLPLIEFGTEGDDAKYGAFKPETPEMTRVRDRALDLLAGMPATLDFPSGLTAMGRGDFPEGAKRLERYTAVEGWDAAALLLQGICFYFTRDLDKSEAALTKSLGLSPQPETYFRRGLVWIEKRELRRAEEDLSRAMEQEPDEHRSFLWRGHVRAELGNLEGAISDHVRCTELKPRDSGSWNSLGRDRFLKNDFAGALKDFDKACETGPQDSSCHYNRGNARLNLGDRKGAIGDYDRALAIDPSNSRAYANRGNARKFLGEYSIAVGDFDLALKHDPKNLVALAGRGFCKYKSNDLDGARKDLDLVLERHPDYVHSIYHRALVRKAQADWSGALEDSDRAVKLRPKDPHYHVDRGLILEGCDQLAEAEKAIALGLRLAPPDWDRKTHAANHLKRIRGKLKRLEE